jgi:preprotein translocase subunit SecE
MSLKPHSYKTELHYNFFDNFVSKKLWPKEKKLHHYVLIVNALYARTT